MKKLLLTLLLIPSCIFSTEQEILDFVEYEMFIYQYKVQNEIQLHSQNSFLFHYYVGRLESYSQIRDFIKHELRD